MWWQDRNIEENRDSSDPVLTCVAALSMSTPDFAHIENEGLANVNLVQRALDNANLQDQ
jgi:hypothetical protein